MVNILEEIYFGNLSMNVIPLDRNLNMKKSMDILVDCEEKLINLLDGKEKKLFLDYVNAWSVVNGESEFERFNFGFNLGLKLTAQSLLKEI